MTNLSSVLVRADSPQCSCMHIAHGRFNNDAYVDLYIARIGDSGEGCPNILFMGGAGESFTETAEGSPLAVSIHYISIH
jgi:hypothetical protein